MAYKFEDLSIISYILLIEDSKSMEEDSFS